MCLKFEFVSMNTVIIFVTFSFREYFVSSAKKSSDMNNYTKLEIDQKLLNIFKGT